jgi:hypothetical protein
MAGIPHVFIFSDFVEMLGGDEEWPREISLGMDMGGFRLRGIGVGEDGCPALTEFGIECLGQIIIKGREHAVAHKLYGDARPPRRSGTMQRLRLILRHAVSTTRREVSSALCPTPLHEASLARASHAGAQRHLPERSGAGYWWILLAAPTIWVAE